MNSETITDLAAGDYTVTVEDEYSCVTVQTFSTTPIEPQEVLPFIQQVEVFAESTTTGEADLIYRAEWVQVSAGCYIYDGGMETIPQSLLDEISLGNRKIKVIAVSNVALSFLNLDWPGLIINNPITPTPTSLMTFEFILDEQDAAGVVQNNTIHQGLKFTGNDFAVPPNNLVDMKTASNNKEDCVDIPALQVEDCVWFPSADPNWSNFDDAHSLERECLEIVVIDINPVLGEISVDAEGGLAPYDFTWFNNGGIVGSGQIITGVPPGDYCVKVKDANGCTIEHCIELCPNLLDIIDDITSVEPVCNDLTGGGLCLDDQNGKYALQVLWSTGSHELCIDDLIGTVYEVTITELNCGQTIEHSFDLGNIALPPMQLSLGASTPTCSGESNGSVCVAVIGGKSPYNYQWENGSETACSSQLGNGQCHSVTVTDACGETASQCFTLPSYQVPSIDFVEVNNTCGETNTGSAQVFFSGGKKPFTFDWARPILNIVLS